MEKESGLFANDKGISPINNEQPFAITLDSMNYQCDI